MLNLEKYITKVGSKVPSDVGKKLEYFLATGNLLSSTGLDLQQTSGYTIVAEKLNFYRYISHFRSVHRGSFFAELKTTTVRKLLPEAWGFLCPVHTPDGSPCGLLNHLSHSCQIVTGKLDVSKLHVLISSYPGVCMISLLPKLDSLNPIVATKSNQILSIQLDGKIIGWCLESTASKLAKHLRLWKITKQHNVNIF